MRDVGYPVSMKYAPLNLYRNPWHLFIAIGLILTLISCTHQPLRHTTTSDCTELKQAFNESVVRSAVRDSQSVPAWPGSLLHVDRFLASFHGQMPGSEQKDMWLARLISLGEQARNIEWSNLPPFEQVTLTGMVASNDTVLGKLGRCARDEGSHAEAVGVWASVPDEYRTLWRVFGLYPLTSLWVAHRAGDLRRELKSAFTRNAPSLGSVLRFGPDQSPTLDRSEVAELIQASVKNPLSIPEPNNEALARLFASFAPVWEVDVIKEDDLPGAPVWRNSKIPSIDTTQPRVYTYHSHARFDGRILLQLNYVIWFPARTCNGALDIYCGKFDGVTWRVTLDTDGTPLTYDSMHNCGCYHFWVPSERLVLRQHGNDLEPPLVVKQAPELSRHGRILLRLAGGTHYIQQVSVVNSPAVDHAYQLGSYDELRSLPLPEGGRRSLFNPEGIVTSSLRAERWVLWPMGVPGPGAMRQRGHHAIAFAGRRHFDDPKLLDRTFMPLRGAAP